MGARHQVVVPLIAVRVAGQERYLSKGSILPVEVSEADVERLTSLNLVRAVEEPVVEAADESPSKPAGDAPVKPAGNAGVEKWSAYAAALGVVVPEGSDRDAVKDLIAAHEAAQA